jgi:lysyl-tRNA synthetase class I
MSGEPEEIKVPCPCCGKVHSVRVKDIKENKSVKVDCGATLGSVGLQHRLDIVNGKIKKFQGSLHKLD